jgi:hypothetical protein
MSGRFMRDDEGSMMLYLTFIASCALLIVLWIFCTPVMNIMIKLYNGFIGEGWVSVQSSQTFSIVDYAWSAVPALGLILLFAALIIRAYIAHDGGY